MKKLTKCFSLLLIVGMLLSMLAACGTETTSSAEKQNSSTEQSAVGASAETPNLVSEEDAKVEESDMEPSAEEQDETGPVLTEEQQKLIELIPEGEYLTFQEYPLSEDPDASLSVFYSMHPLLNQFFENPAELPITARTEEITGVHIDYTVASFMNADTQVHFADGFRRPV